MDRLKQQEEFQKLAGQEIPEDFEVPSIHVRKRRLNLALEELIELSEAYGLPNYFANRTNLVMQKLVDKHIEGDTEEYDKVEAFDAVLDIAVINNGTIIDTGFKNIFDAGYDLVHENNMAKGHGSFEEAELTANKYRSEGVPCSIKKVKTSFGVLFSVVREEDDKLLKPKDFINVNLKELVK
jgi:predicted HAD superfamily Cof-like phosphohydrolase